MKHTLLNLIALCALLLSTASTEAHPGDDHPPDLRVWRDAEGSLEFEASFVLARGDEVQLRINDDTLIMLPLSRFCEADQQWVRDRVRAIEQVNGTTLQVPSTAPATGDGKTVGSVPSTSMPAFAAGALLGCLAAGAVVLRGKPFIRSRVAAAIVMISLGVLAADAEEKIAAPAIQKHFEPFKDKLKFRSDDRYLYVESDGFPDHPMMVGITAWQQQVPLRQPYNGDNAWRIPLHPRMADKPVSAKTALFRGAIALAANGVPIFNPIKNDGKTDTFLAGELDEFGGHCGRADDYHYHVAPVHLQKVVGPGNPIGYALDGFPLHGFTDAGGKEPTDLDEFNGRMEKDGYRYYSTKKYPYVNGGLRGVVTVRDDQIDPQPRANPVRPAGPPLRGAKITGFNRDDEKKTYSVKYELSGKPHAVTYTVQRDGTYRFVFTDGAGKETTEIYRSRRPEGKGDRPPPGDDGPRRREDAPPKKGDAPARAAPAGEFKLTSPAFEDGGKYPVEFTGDGAGESPPLEWSGAPADTKFYALQLWHKPAADGEGVTSYWVITNIPASVTHLARNTKGVGKDGYNDKRRTGYDPMNSKGPGVKEYHITLYALSAEPKFTADKVTRADLLKAIENITLAQATLNYKYERRPK